MAIPSMKEVMQALAPSIVHLRVLESLIECTTHVFPLSNLRTLAFQLHNQPGMDLVQLAIQSLAALETLHIFTSTANATAMIASVLEVMPSIPKVTSLRIVTGSNRVCLPSALLLHLTALEMGLHVTIDHVPARLCCMRLEDLQSSPAEYSEMFKQMEKLSVPVSIVLDFFSPALLMMLPSNLQQLSLLQPFQAGQLSEDGQHEMRAIFSRLPDLEVLRIGNFLNDIAVKVLSGLSLLGVHTFGFRMLHDLNVFDIKRIVNDEPADTYIKDTTDEWVPNVSLSFLSQWPNKALLRPSVIVAQLRTVLPMLQQLEVDFEWKRAFNYRRPTQIADHPKVFLDCSNLNQKVFPLLRGIACRLQNGDLQLANLPASCYAVIKANSVH